MSTQSKTASYIHKVQYYETDKMQIVHHSNYFRFYEEARTHFMESVGLNYDRLEEHGIFIPVTAVSAEYIGAASYPHELEIKSEILYYTGVRMTVGYEVYDLATNKLINKGKTMHAFVDQEFKPFAMQKRFPKFHQIFSDYTVASKED